MSDADWIALVAPARQGDVAAIEQLEQRLAPYAHAVLLSRVSHQVASALVPQVLAQVLFRLHELRDDSELGQRIAGVARTLGAESARSTGAAVEQADSDPLVTQGRRLLTRVRELPELARELVLLRLLEGIPGFEIAELLGLPEADVRAGLEKAVAALVRGLNGQELSLAGDGYLWLLAGTPHPALIPLENQLTALRFSLAGSGDKDQTPSAARGVTELGREGLAPVGRRPTNSLVRMVLHGTGETVVPADEGEGATIPGREPQSKSAPLLPLTDVRPDAKGPRDAGHAAQGTAVKTIGVANLPAEASFGLSPERTASSVGDVPPALGTRSQATAPVFGATAPSATSPVPPDESARGRGSGPRKSAGLGVEAKSGSAAVPANFTALSPMEVDRSVLSARPAPALEDDAPPTRQVPSKPMNPVTSAPIEAEPTGINPTPAETHSRPLSVLARPPATEPGPGRAAAREASKEADWRTAAALEPPRPSKAPPRSFNPMQGRWPFAVAAALAVVAAGVVALLVSGTSNAVKRGWTLVSVVVANADIPEGARITQELVSTRAVPEQFVTSSVVKPDSVGYIVDQQLLVPVQAGDPLLWSQFETAKSSQRLSTRVQKHARATSVMVGTTATVGGWVQPSDHVDLICLVKDPSDPQKSRAVTLLQNVVILTTGKLSPLTNAYQQNPALKHYTDLSLLLLPEEVELVALAQEVGDLKLTLRHEDDTDLRQNGFFSTSDTLLDGRRVRLLERKRFETIQLIRGAQQQPAP
ncbi:MAG: Flp pilus assembly protein CpaB [Myxococcaceae bacterium]|nr:Flp pilus assembly protein CpaB [Myxococcaceae bacterium]